MADRPVIFAAPMIGALLAGEKTQTRRIIKPQPTCNVSRHCWYDSPIYGFTDQDSPTDKWETARLLAALDDRLWVREAHAICRCSESHEGGGDTCYFEWDSKLYGEPRQYLGRNPRFTTCATLHYRADGKDETPSELWPIIGVDGKKRSLAEIRWRPSIHMPRWASRLTLTVTDVRVQRLQEITEEDAIAEGCRGRLGPNPDFPDEWDPTPVEHFGNTWRDLYGPTSWHENPWVAALTFTVERRNIDAQPAASRTLEGAYA